MQLLTPNHISGWYEPILVGGLTYIGRHRDLYSFVVGAI